MRVARPFIVHPGRACLKQQGVAVCCLRRFALRIQWPLANGQCHWKQTSNPMTTTNGSVSGYVPINVSATGATVKFGGLRFDGQNALLNGATDTNTWFYAIGSFATWSGGIPG